MTAIPRVEAGHFVCVPADGMADDSTLDAVADRRGLRLVRDGEVFARCEVAGTSTEVLVSPDGRWVWHLGVQGQATVTLHEAGHLDVVGTHHPSTRSTARDAAPSPVDDWMEHSAATFREAPDMLVVYANLGDSFTLLLTLRATEAGIVDEVGTRLFDAAAECLDEVIWAARFVDPTRFLLVDDTGNLTLLSWPDATTVARVSVCDGLRDDNHDVLLWPDDGAVESAVVGESTWVVGDVLLVSVCDADDPDTLTALVALEVQTLTPLGLVRPPVEHAADLQRLVADSFLAKTNAGDRALKFVRPESLGGHDLP